MGRRTLTKDIRYLVTTLIKANYEYCNSVEEMSSWSSWVWTKANLKSCFTQSEIYLAVSRNVRRHRLSFKNYWLRWAGNGGEPLNPSPTTRFPLGFPPRNIVSLRFPPLSSVKILAKRYRSEFTVNSLLTGTMKTFCLCYGSRMLI